MERLGPFADPAERFVARLIVICDEQIVEPDAGVPCVQPRADLFRRRPGYNRQTRQQAPVHRSREFPLGIVMQTTEDLQMARVKHWRHWPCVRRSQGRRG